VSRAEILAGVGEADAALEEIERLLELLATHTER
jgi:hypothetical protein